MKLKGIASKRRKFTGSVLPNYAYGEALSTDSDFYAFVNAYRGWVYVCGGRNATTVAQAPLRLYATKESKDEKIRSFPTREVSPETKNYLYSNPSLIQKESIRRSQDIEEITSHPFLDVLTNVNGFMNRFTLFETLQMHLELTGNAYLYIVENRLKIPQELWVLPSQNVRIIPDKTKFIKGYEYYKNGCNFYGSNDSVFYKESEVVHFKMPSPKNIYYGVSPLAAVTEEYSLGQAMNKYEDRMFKNNGKLEGAFYTDETLGDHEFERIQNQLKALRGNEHVGRSPLLDSGLKFQPYSYSPKDMAYSDGRDKVQNMICAAYGQTIGIYSESATRSNSEAAIKLYKETAIYPRLLRVEEKLNEKLIPRYSDRLFVAYDKEVPTFDQKQKEKDLNLRTGFSTVNMERRKDNLPPVSWGNTPYIPVNMMAFEMMEKQLNEMPVEEANKMIRNLNEVASAFDRKVEESGVAVEN